jgi:hypothetical protein
MGLKMERSNLLFIYWLLVLCGVGQLLALALKCLAIGESQGVLLEIKEKSYTTVCRVEEVFINNKIVMTAAGLVDQKIWIANVTYLEGDRSKWYFPLTIPSTLIKSSFFDCTIVSGEWPSPVVVGDLSYPLITGDLMIMVIQGLIGITLSGIALERMFALRR